MNWSLLLLTASVLLSAAPALAQPRLAVVELFTSQGCSSCPPANDNVAALSNRPDVLALTFGVTYWDKLGWKDTFASGSYTDRQYAYAKALKHDAPFTPEVVVDGQVYGVGAHKGEIETLMAKARLTGPEVEIAGGAVEIGAGQGGRAPADVWLVRYDPRVVQVPIRAGENTGKTLPHKNVVKALVRLGGWSGKAERFTLPPGAPGLSTAVLVQVREAGPILGAARG